jgi:hypothetical protein
MAPDKIEEYIESKQRKNIPVNIHFKDRNTVTGLFVQTPDYDELKSKNLWRIVNNMHLNEWNNTKSIELTRIFNGMSFTRLSDEK